MRRITGEAKHIDDTMTTTRPLANYINGAWHPAKHASHVDVTNPATGDVLATAPMTSADEVHAAVQAAHEAFPDWRRVPAPDRVQPLFQLKQLLEDHLDELARTITEECGKTYNESVGELRRGIENVETACGIPSLMQGANNEDIARGIDEHMIRQPLGVVAAITPFNFPGMIPLWFLPYAIATGNCFILKPSEKVPMTTAHLFELLDEVDLPDGVVQLIHGGKDTVDALLDHAAVRAISFVGSTPVARYIYRRAAENGKRAQCQGGAKNTVVVLPDADLDMTTQIVADSAFGCAGQRCLANSLAITVGAAREPFTEAIAEVAAQRRVGYGLDEDVEMGPVITDDSRTRIEQLVGRAEAEGARVLVDGRGKTVDGFENGHWVFPTLLDEVPPDGETAQTEIFGPVFGLMHVDTVDEAIRRINEKAYGNMACIFTSSGAAARQFRYEVDAGNVGINIGVAAPMAFFPFSGWKDSFFGDLHAQGRHGVEFYTQTKVVVERWPDAWSRKF
jgi:malonate-semialdehyde dehydrogenase (acetylating)/methylmalonate-semialdehyde dehydrogenase